MFRDYLKSITDVANRGDAREESFYGALAGLLEQFAASTDRDDVHVTTLPRPTEAGNPDFRVWNGRDAITGYVEAKLPAEEYLDRVEGSEQLRRYRETFPNLILTNFLEFRLYRDGRQVERVQLARPRVLHDLGRMPPVEQGDELRELLEQFFAFALPKTYTAEELALELAKRTRFLRDVVLDELRKEEAGAGGMLSDFFKAFQTYLIANLTLEDFADLYAQTITYGLFAARTRAENGFNRRQAFDNIPHTIGILRDVFRFISLGDMPASLEWIVDDISEVLAVADVVDILDRYYHEGKGSDPIVHFYETFLAAYDPEERERRGVYYTPEPVVDYIVRSLDKLLQEKFGRTDGLADTNVTLLDPAAGTMTFVARAVRQAVEDFEEKYGAGARTSFIRDHILKKYYAFELMMAPYAVGHLKMSFFLEELGYRLSSDERFRFYLTNTLEMEELAQTHLPGMASLAEESQLAGKVKKERPILVILGNPPYSVSSSNKSDFIEEQMGAYKELVKSEQNLMPLSDDYVKFIRFAQWKIEQRGDGMIGMITNHGYLENPTFRGMRWSLLESFDEIHVLDLHGNSLKRETAPDGSKDENVFDIRQGVAITFFVKRGSGGAAPATVYHSDLWGLREEKYAWLHDHDVTTTEWQALNPQPEFYLFVPRDEVALARYEEFYRITGIFPTFSTGIKTHRDHFVLDFDREKLERRIRMFRDSSLSHDIVRKSFSLRDNRDWKMVQKREKIQQDDAWLEKITQCLYRPFDVHWLFYHHEAIDFGREEVMRHMLAGENVGLVAMRQVALNEPYTHVLATDKIIDNRLFLSSKGTAQLHPLYLYPDIDRRDLFSVLEDGERRPNLAAGIVRALAEAYGTEPTPEDIFYYVYAVLYAPSYREKYAEFLKIDFPRVPFTVDHELFSTLAGLGQRLADLHLLRSDALDPPVAQFQGAGDNRVARTKRQGYTYDPKTERVYINQEQYFAPVPLEIYEYQIGGYQVADKWLKDRKERELNLDDIKTYCRIITALRHTIDLQEEIDALYPDVEAEIVEIG